MGQAQPVTHPGQPPQRLLRPAASAGLPSPQRLPHLPRLPTTVEFLGVHREQAERNRKLVAVAEANGQFRLVDNHRRVQASLDEIIQRSQPSRSNVPYNTIRLLQAAAARHHNAVVNAIAAIQDLHRAGQPITFQAVAAAAGVSRSWLYRDPEIRAEIERLRATLTGTAAPVPARERASRESLRKQLEALRIELAELRRDNKLLRDQLARRLGEERTTATWGQRRTPTTTGGS